MAYPKILRQGSKLRAFGGEFGVFCYFLRNIINTHF